MQSHGTARVAACFGPITGVWFGIIGLLGVIEIVKQPEILHALNPYYGSSC